MGCQRELFLDSPDSAASIHVVEISEDAQTHYHKGFTEIYLILETEGEAFIELDGEMIAVKPMTTILIKPGYRHRAVGKMKIIKTAIPKFDPYDEWFD